MNAIPGLMGRCFSLLIAVSIGFGGARAVAAELPQPTIERIQMAGAEVVLTVKTPPGAARVAIQTRSSGQPGAWDTKASLDADAQGGTLEFRLPKSDWMAFFRATADLEVQPVITSITCEGDELLVKVRVPPRLKKVTLESRLGLSSPAWAPRSVQRMDGEGGEVVFRLQKTDLTGVLRVKSRSE